MPRSPSPMVNENTFLMPWYQIRLVRQLTRVAGMKRARFMDFKRIIISTANMHLNTEIRPEEQDIGALGRFMNTVHERDPTISKSYEESWPVMAYLELYLVGRIRYIRHKNRRYGYRKRYAMCPDPIWVRYAEVRTTGRFRVNQQSEGKRRGRPPLRPSDSRQSPSNRILGTDDHEKQAKHENRESTSCESLSDKDSEDQLSQGDGSETVIIESGESDRSTPSDPLVDFLTSVRPNLMNFQSHFVDMGFTNGEALNAFFSWPLDVQEDTMKTQFSNVMNVIQLTGLLVTLRGRQREQ